MQRKPVWENSNACTNAGGRRYRAIHATGASLHKSYRNISISLHVNTVGNESRGQNLSKRSMLHVFAANLLLSSFPELALRMLVINILTDQGPNGRCANTSDEQCAKEAAGAFRVLFEIMHKSLHEFNLRHNAISNDVCR